LYEQILNDNKEKNTELISLNSKLSLFEERSKGLEQRLEEHRNELISVREQMKLEFKDISNEIFEEKSSKFLELNEKKVSEILNPLRDKIKDFESKVERTYNEETIQSRTGKRYTLQETGESER
jgi:DNA recombination protein RmuC